MSGLEKVRIEHVKEKKNERGLKNQIALVTEICSAGFLTNSVKDRKPYVKTLLKTKPK